MGEPSEESTDGLSERKANVSVEVASTVPQEMPQTEVTVAPMSDERGQEFAHQQRSRNPSISFHHKTIALSEVAGTPELGMSLVVSTSGVVDLLILASETNVTSNGSLSVT